MDRTGIVLIGFLAYFIASGITLLKIVKLEGHQSIMSAAMYQGMKWQIFCCGFFILPLVGIAHLIERLLTLSGEEKVDAQTSISIAVCVISYVGLSLAAYTVTYEPSHSSQDRVISCSKEVR